MIATKRWRYGFIPITAFLLASAPGCTRETAPRISGTIADVEPREERNEERGDERDALVRVLRAKGIRDESVLRAIGAVPRHRFVPQPIAGAAYEDRPLPIGHRQTISQPYIVAYMSEALRITPGMKVLEIGTGSGYQAAVLAELGAKVYSIEIIPELSEAAQSALAPLPYDEIHLRVGDGYKGWREHAPFDRILLTAAPGEIPDPLIEQLARGGRLVTPLTDSQTGRQWIWEVTKDTDGSIRRERTLAVRFVPMTGEARERP